MTVIPIPGLFPEEEGWAVCAAWSPLSQHPRL